MPDDAVEEFLEALRRIGIVERKVDDDVVGISNRLTHLLRSNARVLARFGKVVECTKPRIEIRDRVFDVQRRHAFSSAPRPGDRARLRLLGESVTEWHADVGEAAWLCERIRGFAQNVGSVLPHGFASYARIFHPLESAEEPRWADLARRNNRIPHAEMQYQLIACPPGEVLGPYEHVQHMAIGQMPQRELRLLVDVLERHTSIDEPCFFALWDGFGIAPPEALEGPRVELPNRSYLLLSGALREVRDLPTLLQGQTPNIWWPKDRAWCVATEIDLGSTYIGGSEPLIGDLLESEALEALRCRVSDGVTISSDLLNAAPANGDVDRFRGR